MLFCGRSANSKKSLRLLRAKKRRVLIASRILYLPGFFSIHPHNTHTTHMSRNFSRAQIDKFQMCVEGEATAAAGWEKKIQLNSETINSYQRFGKLLLVQP